MPIIIFMACCWSTWFYFIFWISFSASVLWYSFGCISIIRIHLKISDVKIGIFPILIAYWSWFKIFKQMARLGWEHSLNLLQLNFVVSGLKKQGCREPIRTVFRQLFDHNADSLVDETELADLYEAEPCMKQFFKTCSKGKETFTEPEFCSCFKSVGRSQVHIYNFPSVNLIPLKPSTVMLNYAFESPVSHQPKCKE